MGVSVCVRERETCEINKTINTSFKKVAAKFMGPKKLREGIMFPHIKTSETI